MRQVSNCCWRFPEKLIGLQSISVGIWVPQSLPNSHLLSYLIDIFQLSLSLSLFLSFFPDLSIWMKVMLIYSKHRKWLHLKLSALDISFSELIMWRAYFGMLCITVWLNHHHIMLFLSVLTKIPMYRLEVLYSFQLSLKFTQWISNLSRKRQIVSRKYFYQPSWVMWKCCKLGYIATLFASFDGFCHQWKIFTALHECIRYRH